MTTHTAPPLPTPRTPGFALAGARCHQVLLAVRARYIAHGHCRSTVQRIADDCGCGRAAVGSALGELADLGWVTVADRRDAGGRHVGVDIRLRPPPAEMPDAAIDRYVRQVAARRKRASADRERLLQAVPGAIRDDVAQVLAGEHRLAELTQGIAAETSRSETMLAEAAALGERLVAGSAEQAELLERMEQTQSGDGSDDETAEPDDGPPEPPEPAPSSAPPLRVVGGTPPDKPKSVSWLTRLTYRAGETRAERECRDEAAMRDEAAREAAQCRREIEQLTTIEDDTGGAMTREEVWPQMRAMQRKADALARIASGRAATTDIEAAGWLAPDGVGSPM